MTGWAGGDGPGMAPLDPPPADRAGPRSSWLLVVARGHPRLLAELEAMFRHHPRVQVIEDRRRGRVLLPRADAFMRIGVSTN
jgi:hypothetical protein